MKQSIFIFLISFGLYLNTTAQNVGINASGVAPNTSAMLDVDVSSLGATAKKGMLIPRLALASVTDVATVPSPATSLLVYNTTAASTGTNAVFPGFYYWDGTVWIALSGNGSRDWALQGNAGTVAGTNFLGTTDNADLVFKVNNIQGGKINIADNQTFLGYQAGLNSGTTAGNSFFGYNSGTANSSGTHNTAVGYLTFTTSASGSFNTTTGYGSMRNNLSGSNNTFLGVNAGANWSTASNNTGVGMFALQGLPGGTGTGNTALGYGAGSGITPNNLATGNGSYNTLIGYNAALNASTYSNASAIGANALAGGSDVMVLGSIEGINGALGDIRVGIGTTIPLSSLHAVASATSAFLYCGRFEHANANNNSALWGRSSAAAGAGTTNGVLGTTAQSLGFGVRASNSNTSGTGILASGENAAGTYLPAGSGGAFSGALTGLVSKTTNAAGTGIRASGQGVATYPSLLVGSGGAFSGTTRGVYGIANNVANDVAGGYFTNGNGSFAFVGYTTAGGVAQKINGPGAVSTIVKNTKNELVNLYCPESPEVLFQDFGTGQLVNGFIHVNLDENLSKNITVNEKHPLRVIIQLEGDCKGVFVTNKTNTGFDVKELQGGNSNTAFTWFISANRADAYNDNGTLFSKFEDVRFGEAPSPEKTINSESVKVKPEKVD